MPLLRAGLTLSFAGGPVLLANNGGGSLSILVTNGTTTLYTDVAGSVTQVAQTSFAAQSFARLSTGSYLLLRQTYDLNYGGADFEVLGAQGSLLLGDTDVASGTGRSITGPVATATANGGFFIGYTDGANASATNTITFSPPDQNNGTSANLSEAGDVGYRTYTPTAGNAPYQAGAFTIANTGNFTTNSNYGPATGPNTAGQQTAASAIALANGTVVESYVNQYYYSNSGLSTANQIAVRLITAAGPGNQLTVSQTPVPTSTLDAPDMVVQGSGGIQLVALPTGFAVIWHDVHYDPSSAFGGYTANGYDTKIRYFDTTGAALTNTILLYNQSNDVNTNGQLGASADSLGDGRIAIVYDNAALSQGGGYGTQLSVGIVGALGSTFNTTTITGLTSGQTFAKVDLVSTGGSTIAVAYTGSSNGSVVTTFNTAVPLDFNGDGRSDLLLQNDSGAIVLETTNGLAVTGGGLINNPGPTWHVVGAADFNGDGQNDILLQNDNGAIVDYLMNGTTITVGNFLTNPGPTWHVRGTGDFNADGKSDIVLQNDNGLIFVEYTNGATVTGGATVSNPGPTWTVEGVADFNGDGQPDLLLQKTDGTLFDFLMNGAVPVAGFQLLGPNTGYSVAGTGAYNADNDADILLHNDNGTDVVLYTNAVSVIGSSAPIGNPGPTWTGAVGGLDFNGDGASDLLIENTSGSFVGYTLNPAGAVTGGTTLTNPGAGWRAAGGPPMQFIDGTTAATTLAGTPGPDEFNFTTSMPGIHTITNFDATIDLIALSAASFPTYAAVQSHESAYNGGTAIGLSANAAIVIAGITPDQLSSANFVLR